MRNVYFLMNNVKKINRWSDWEREVVCLIIKNKTLEPSQSKDRMAWHDFCCSL